MNYLQTYTLFLDEDAPNFEIKCKGKTCALGPCPYMEDGGVIYIAFSNGGNTKVSKATIKSCLGVPQYTVTSLNAIGNFPA